MENSIVKELSTFDELYSEERPSDVNLKKLADFLGVRQTQLAKGLRLDETTLSKTPYAPHNSYLKQWMTIFNLIVKVINAANPKLTAQEVKLQMQRWLKLPRPEFENSTPLDYMMKGKARRVKNILEQLL